MKWLGQGKPPNNHAEIKLANIGYSIAKELFNVDLYYHQALIFAKGIDEENHRNLFIITTTRYGKSFTLSLVALYWAKVKNKKVKILAHNTHYANVIMSEVSKNLVNACDFIKEGLTATDKFERLALQISKSGITYPQGGSIHAISLMQSSNRSSQAIGFGADIVMIDESALVTNQEHDIALRMSLETQKFKRIEISNPHKRNHFYRDFNNPKYSKIHVNHQTAIEEERITEEQVEALAENMTADNFKIFVESEFLDNGSNNKVFNIAKCNRQKCPPDAPRINETIVLGVDVGRYNDYTVVVGYDSNIKPTYYERFTGVNLEVQAEKIKSLWAELNYPKVYVDKGGIGQGLYDNLFLTIGSRLIGIQFNNSNKQGLVQNAQLLIEKGRVTIPDYPEVVEEMMEYEMYQNRSGLITYSNPEQLAENGEMLHDDCCIALMLALQEFKLSPNSGLGFIPLQ